MEPSVSFITLGVVDLPTATGFYADVLGLPLLPPSGDEASFFNMGALQLALYPRHLLAAAAGVADAGSGFDGVVLSHNVESRDAVDAVLAQVAAAGSGCGARVTRPAAPTEWGSHAGFFADPDGFVWEVVWNPQRSNTDRGNE